MLTVTQEARAGAGGRRAGRPWKASKPSNEPRAIATTPTSLRATRLDGVSGRSGSILSDLRYPAPMPQNYGALERVLRVGEGPAPEAARRAGRLHHVARAGLRSALRRGARRQDRRVQAAAGERRGPRRARLRGLRRRPRGGQAHARHAPFDVQLMGAIVLHEGDIAEMKTGEGKTLVATMPLYLNALTGDNVHLVTVNDYLAKRDAEWMGPVYEALGMRAALHPQHDALRRAQGRLRGGHHVRDELRVRLRLPARQHGDVARRHRPARPHVRDRGRGRLDPHRRGADAADHLRRARDGREDLLRLRARRAAARRASRRSSSPRAWRSRRTTPTTSSTRSSRPSRRARRRSRRSSARSGSRTSTTRATRSSSTT